MPRALPFSESAAVASEQTTVSKTPANVPVKKRIKGGGFKRKKPGPKKKAVAQRQEESSADEETVESDIQDVVFVAARQVESPDHGGGNGESDREREFDNSAPKTAAGKGKRAAPKTPAPSKSSHTAVKRGPGRPPGSANKTATKAAAKKVTVGHKPITRASAKKKAAVVNEDAGGLDDQGEYYPRDFDDLHEDYKDPSEARKTSPKTTGKRKPAVEIAARGLTARKVAGGILGSSGVYPVEVLSTSSSSEIEKESDNDRLEDEIIAYTNQGGPSQARKTQAKASGKQKAVAHKTVRKMAGGKFPSSAQHAQQSEPEQESEKDDGPEEPGIATTYRKLRTRTIEKGKAVAKKGVRVEIARKMAGGMVPLVAPIASPDRESEQEGEDGDQTEPKFIANWDFSEPSQAPGAQAWTAVNQEAVVYTSRGKVTRGISGMVALSGQTLSGSEAELEGEDAGEVEKPVFNTTSRKRPATSSATQDVKKAAKTFSGVSPGARGSDKPSPDPSTSEEPADNHKGSSPDAENVSINNAGEKSPQHAAMTTTAVGPTDNSDGQSEPEIDSPRRSYGGKSFPGLVALFDAGPPGGFTPE